MGERRGLEGRGGIGLITIQTLVAWCGGRGVAQPSKTKSAHIIYTINTYKHI